MKRISIIGSGNWGSTIGKIVGENLPNLAGFERQVKMWVYEEMIDGKKLTEIINNDHTNPKYLPNIQLPENLVADPDLLSAAKDSDYLIFVLPHQFLALSLEKLKGNVKPSAIAISLAKGFISSKENHDISLVSDMIKRELGIDCGVLMGANIATEVAKEAFCESTIAFEDMEHSLVFKKIFQTEYFRIATIQDIAVCEICGALKNIVALGAGIADGLKLGDNTKAALIRMGLIEIQQFIATFFSDRKPKVETYLESCGIADLVATCYGGRNRKVGEELAKSGDNLADIEKRLLNGQSAQGPITAEETFNFLQLKSKVTDFPILTGIHKICIGQVKPDTIIDFLKDHPCHE